MVTTFRSEILKMKYNKWLHLTAFFCIACVSVFAMTFNNASGSESGDFIMRQILESLYQLQTGFIILATLYYGQELTSKNLRTTLVSTPNRGKHLLAKIASLVFYGTILFVLVTGVLLLTVKNFYKIPLDKTFVLEVLSRAWPAYVSTISISVIALALTVITNSAIITMSALVTITVGLGQMLMQISEVFKYAPILAVFDVFCLHPTNYYLNYKLGILVQSLWAVILVVVAYFRLDKKLVK